MPLFRLGPELPPERILKLRSSGSKLYLGIDFLVLSIIQIDHEINDSQLSRNITLKKHVLEAEMA